MTVVPLPSVTRLIAMGVVRVPFAAIVLYSPLIAVGSYFTLGVVVLASRLLFPKPKSIAAQPQQVEAANEQRELAEAA